MGRLATVSKEWKAVSEQDTVSISPQSDQIAEYIIVFTVATEHPIQSPLSEMSQQLDYKSSDTEARQSLQ
jgi:hypothetical protein